MVFLLLFCCGGPTRTGDLQVMSLASYQLLHSAMLIFYLLRHNLAIRTSSLAHAVSSVAGAKVSRKYGTHKHFGKKKPSKIDINRFILFYCTLFTNFVQL